MARKLLGALTWMILLTAVLFSATQLATAEGLNTVTHSGSVNPVGSTITDLGLINIDGGIVESVFELYNGGSKNLFLKGAFTSCACTKVSIELPDGTISRPFGMSVPTDWVREVAPGERFKVRVLFDPAFHGKDGTGAFRRDIYLITSAPPDDYITSSLPMIRHGSVSKLKLRGEVVTAEKFTNRELVRPLSRKIGDFRFPTSVLDAGVVKQSGPSARVEMQFRYEGDVPVKITGTPTSCACVSASVSKTTLKPGEGGSLTIEFDPNYHKEPDGRFFKDILILTEPSQTEEVSIRLWAEVDLDLGPESYKFKEHDDEDGHVGEEDGHGEDADTH